MQAGEERGHDAGLVVGELGGEVPPHAGEVHRGRGPQPFHSDVAENGVDYPAVVLRRLAPD